MRIFKIFAVTMCLCAVNVSAQGLSHNVDSELLARAGNVRFNAMDYGMEIVKAAGMELLEDDHSIIIDDLLDYALELQGMRYRRGGKTPAGFDCSGFTGYVFGEFGIKLGADSRSQFFDGEEVDDIRDVQPGDLVFFGGRGAGNVIGHVGIAVEVDYEAGVVTFVHSATSGGVRLDRTDDAYYARRYKGARRIF